MKIETDIKLTTKFFQKCHGELVKRIPKFRVTESLRTIDRQKYLKSTGKSWTMKSNHLFGRAMDIYPQLKGYNTPEAEWNQYHDIWDQIVRGFGGVPEKRIGKDLGHFGIIKEPV